MEKIIFSAYLADFLVKKGFKIIGTRLNFKKPQFVVYRFEDTPELQDAIFEYKKIKYGDKAIY